jgi:hypothetical protein
MDNFNSKIINAEDARTALVDAIADMLHVIKAEHKTDFPSLLIEDELDAAAERAFGHFAAETDGPDNDGLSGVVIVIDGEGKELARYGE